MYDDNIIASSECSDIHTHTHKHSYIDVRAEKCMVYVCKHIMLHFTAVASKNILLYDSFSTVIYVYHFLFCIYLVSHYLKFMLISKIIKWKI